MASSCQRCGSGEDVQRTVIGQQSGEEVRRDLCPGCRERYGAPPNPGLMSLDTSQATERPAASVPEGWEATGGGWYERAADGLRVRGKKGIAAVEEAEAAMEPEEVPGTEEETTGPPGESEQVEGAEGAEGPAATAEETEGD